MADMDKTINGLKCIAGKALHKNCQSCDYSDSGEYFTDCVRAIADDALELLKEQEPDHSKYEYKYDHTDCLWYWSDDLNQCPSTCSQYRDGWNDAMNYIFKGGKGYQPYKRR